MGGPTEPVCSLRACGSCSLLDFSSALVAATRHKRGVSLVLRRCTSRAVCVLLPFIRLFRCCGTTSSATLGLASRRSCHHAIWSIIVVLKTKSSPNDTRYSIHFSLADLFEQGGPQAFARSYACLNEPGDAQRAFNAQKKMHRTSAVKHHVYNSSSIIVRLELYKTE